MLHIRCVKINRHFPQTRHQMYLISAMCLCVRCFPASAHLTSVDGWFAVFWMRCFKAGKHLKHAGQCTLRTRVGGKTKQNKKKNGCNKMQSKQKCTPWLLLRKDNMDLDCYHAMYSLYWLFYGRAFWRPAKIAFCFQNQYSTIFAISPLMDWHRVTRWS